jgi:AcrR family transcriptional regulator
MVRDAGATKQRLLDAATAEFAQHGIAGARVDRIARAADSNKAMIYSYFGSKDALFDAVFAAVVVSTVEAAKFDPSDLPGYAGRLFDSFERDPRISRLTTWYQLERPDGAALQTLVVSNEARIDRLREARESGVVPRRYSPVELLTLVRAIAMSWSLVSPEIGAVATGHLRARRREVVVETVRLLLA